MWELYGFPAWDDDAYWRLSAEQLERMVETAKYVSDQRAAT